MFVHQITYRVTYADTDKMGYMYYGNYPRIFETARTESFRSIGFVYKEMEDQCGVMMPVYDLHCKYLAPAFYDELLTIVVKIPKMPTVKCVFDYEIFNEAGKLLTQGNTTLVFADIQTGKITKPPHQLVELLAKYYK